MMKKARPRYVLAIFLLAIAALVAPISRYVVSPVWAQEDSNSGIVASPTSMTYSYRPGSTLPASQKLSVTNKRGAIFSARTSGASWLSISPTTGTTPGSIVVSANPASLASGSYRASIAISSNTRTVTVPVTLTVTSSTASFTVNPSSIAFGFQQSGTLPAIQTLSVASSAGSGTSFTDSASGATWLTVNRTTGTTPGSIGVSANPASLAVGTYTGSVRVATSSGSVAVPVTLTVTSSASTGATNTGYTLMAWSELGMHCMDGKDYSVFSVLPPYNTIYAKLLTVGNQPAFVTGGVTITYQAMKDASGSINTTSYGNSTVAQKTNFWSYARLLFLGQPLPDQGLHNYPVQSLTPQQMTYDTAKGLWKAEGIPTAPYDDSQVRKPYPMAQIVAKNSAGQVLATTTVVLAVSDEMSCSTCHSPNSNSAAMPTGGWVTQYSAAQNVKLNILKKHDDDYPISEAILSALQAKGYTTYQSSLYQTALNGGALNNPVLCASCHSSNALNAAGLNTGVADASGKALAPPLTTSMHSFHSIVTLPGSTTALDNATDPAGSCYQCHPGTTTKCQRGTMSGVACYNCHGNLSRVATPTRQGWLDEPNCQMCHQNGTTYTSAFTSTNLGPTGTQRSSTDATFATTPNVPGTGLSLYRFSKGHGSIECSACHGSQHAEYPTNQPNDNVASINLQGYAGRLTECSVCHSTALAVTSNGGPHGMHTVGQTWVNSHPHYADSGGTASCACCHGSSYRGSPTSQLLVARTFNAGDFGTKTFPAGHQISCYDCHNGPNGD